METFIKLTDLVCCNPKDRCQICYKVLILEAEEVYLFGCGCDSKNICETCYNPIFHSICMKCDKCSTTCSCNYLNYNLLYNV